MYIKAIKIIYKELFVLFAMESRTIGNLQGTFCEYMLEKKVYYNERHC